MRRFLIILGTLGLVSGCSESGDPSRSWEIAAQGLFSGALSPSADFALVGSLNHGASLWSTPEHERLYNWRHQDGQFVELVSASFSPDGSRAVTTDPSTLVLWNTATGESLGYWGSPGVVMDVALFSDNRNILLGLDNHSALVFDATTGAYRQTLSHRGSVGAVSVSQNDRFVLTGSDDFTAIFWDLDNAGAVNTYQHNSPVSVVALSDSARYAFTAAQGSLAAIWDNQTGEMLHEIHKGLNHGVVSARFSADERFLALGYTGRQVALYEVSSGERLRSWDPGVRHHLSARGATILAIAFSAESNALFALTGDGRLLEFRIG